MIQLDDIKRLVNEADQPLLTLYLNVDPAARENQTATPSWRTWLKNTLNEFEATHASDPHWRNLRQQVESYLDTYQPESKSIAMLVGPNEQQVYELEVSLANEAAFGAPLVTPLLWVIDEYEPYLVVMVDQEKARMFTASLGELGFQEAISAEIDTSDWGEKSGMPNSGKGGAGFARGNKKDEFDQRMDEYILRFYRDVATRIDQFVRENKDSRIILGGNAQAAHALRELLPEKPAKQVIDVIEIPMHETTQAIMTRVQAKALEFEREREAELVEQVINLAKSGGRGALGRQTVMHALEQQQVEVLIAPWPLNDSRLRQELPERVFASSGSIEWVHGEAAERLKAEGGLGARLYYATEPA